MEIPKKFYNINDHDYPVIARTVGDLKAALAELPDDLPIEQGFSDKGVDVIVYNVSSEFGTAFLKLRERETDDEEEFDDED